MGVIFRRGPTKSVQLVMWNRATDKFRPGPWFRGRIFPDRSGLSPDGKHMIYFAMGGLAWAIPATGGTWTAISKPPSWRAIALWGQGDTRGGGGMFLSNRSYWLDADQNTSLIRDESGLHRAPARPYDDRMELRGWKVTNRENRVPNFEKTVDRDWILRRIGYEGGYELERPGEAKFQFPSWEWADWDRSRLVWTDAGKLLTAKLKTRELGAVKTLCDFSEPKVK